ncbi:zinc-binding alcohol dehydrogenase family protein [Cellulosimicrobium sp. NPDC055967]|uniref:quinone oxidoreductase family protein n=1 Tax=Cellulosimicrobium sp. NPDC055967 TaxID=3345670 RepID=UPI0035DD1D8E
MTDATTTTTDATTTTSRPAAPRPGGAVGGPAPRTMRAAVFHEHGGPEVLRVAEVPVPTPSPDQVLIQVSHAGVNFAEVMFRRGQIGVGLPHVPGLEVAGTVLEVGAEVTSVVPGDRVAALTLAGGGGAELAVAEARHVVVLDGPLAGLSSAVAAGAVCNVTTAWGAVRLAGRPVAGERVVVLAAAGGVGSAVAALCAAAGAQVVGVVGSADKRAALPTDVFAERWTYDELLASGESFDVVFDAVGGPARAALVSRVAVLGRYVVFGDAARADTSVALDDVWFSGAAFVGYNLGAVAFGSSVPLADHMGAALRSVADGTVPVEPVVLRLEDVAEAHRRLEGRETTGKIVLDLGGVPA